MNQLNEDIRISYTAFWQKFSVILAFSYGIISLILASAAIFGIEPVVEIFNDPEFIRPIFGTFILLFFLNVLIPTSIRSIENYKQRECLVEYEKVISKILSETKIDERSLLNDIKNLEKKRIMLLTSYIKLKIKQQWIREKKQFFRNLKRN